MSTPLITDSLRVIRDGNTVLNDVSFNVSKGQIFALLGGNGAGKSTTLLTFLGFIKPSSGSIKVNDLDVASNLKKIRQQMAYLPESATLYQHLNAYENLQYFLSLSDIQIAESDIDKALDRVSLQAQSRSKNLQSYSKGMRQKVAIALALLRDTPILLLDEPTSGLDPIAIDEFNALVKSLAAENRTILMVTHDVYGACQVADRIGLLRNGELVGMFDRPEEGQIDTETVHAAFAERSIS